MQLLDAGCQRESMAHTSKLLIFAIFSLSAFSVINCDFFSLKFFRQLVPHKRISNETIEKTEAPSLTTCNLKCINRKPCRSTLFTITKNSCVLLKSFFKDGQEFGETTEHDKSAKIIESRLMVNLYSNFRWSRM